MEPETSLPVDVVAKILALAEVCDLRQCALVSNDFHAASKLVSTDGCVATTAEDLAFLLGRRRPATIRIALKGASTRPLLSLACRYAARVEAQLYDGTLAPKPCVAHRLLVEGPLDDEDAAVAAAAAGTLNPNFDGCVASTVRALRFLIRLVPTTLRIAASRDVRHNDTLSAMVWDFVAYSRPGKCHLIVDRNVGNHSFLARYTASISLEWLDMFRNEELSERVTCHGHLRCAGSISPTLVSRIAGMPLTRLTLLQVDDEEASVALIANTSAPSLFLDVRGSRVLRAAIDNPRIRDLSVKARSAESVLAVLTAPRQWNSLSFDVAEVESLRCRPKDVACAVKERIVFTGLDASRRKPAIIALVEAIHARNQ